MNNSRIGIMQGRLTPPKGRGIQFFPFENWQEEFRIAKTLKLSEIEWIFDLERYEENPIWTEAGRSEIKKIIQETRVNINVICADFFMRRPFVKVDEKTRNENMAILEKIIRYAKEIGIKNIEIPFLDNSSVKTEMEEKKFINTLRTIIPLIEKEEMGILIEIDYAPDRMEKLLKSINNPLLKITYDSGNSSGLGFDPNEEFKRYGNHIGHVHIKDRLKDNGTKPLGAGSAEFEKVFRGLGNIKYQGNFILQAARGDEGKEKETVLSQIKFVTEYLKKFSLA